MDVVDRKSGVHNSFVGYALYSGFPSAILVMLAFLLAGVGAWRSRALPARASLFGALLAATVTCLTNVALETPFIAGPAWAIVGAALGASAAPREGTSEHQVSP
jgi:O-antigen ligase